MPEISRVSSQFKDPISYEQFNKVVMLIGHVVSVELNKKAKIPAYLLELTFGKRLDEEHKFLFKKEKFVSSAQLCAKHMPCGIRGQLVMCVVNFPRKQIGSHMSDCLVTGAQREDGSPEEKRETTVFLRPTKEVEAGKRISVKGHNEVVSSLTRNLSWDEFTLVDLRIGTIMEYRFSDIDGSSFKQMSGRVCVDRDGTTKRFFGLVYATFETFHKTTEQLLFWVNPDPEEINDIFCFPFDCLDRECVLLCTLDGGRAGIEPALRVENGFRIA